MKALLFAVAVLASGATTRADPLPSWADGAAKERITAFVDAVTDPENPDYVPGPDRIAVFDNDGTLWAEQPAYFQVIFALDRLAAMAEDVPSILTTDALKSAAAGDFEAVAEAGLPALLEIVDVTHAGMSVEEFQVSVDDWLATAVHPDTGRPYPGMTYQPMLELLSYFRDNDFATYIVSGGGVHFMRAFAEDTYGIPPWQVIGSVGNSSYRSGDRPPAILKDPGLFFVDDAEGKPVAIDRAIGQRPIFVAGNSDGDFAMLEWATAGDGPRLGLIVHHTDAAREWAYDRGSHVGRLERGLDEGPERGWLIVDMVSDWRTVFAEQD
jgi:phosphoglycolate phosphatase-like HAD superfamily hydrolase